jgi:hypothetical protein
VEFLKETRKKSLHVKYRLINTVGGLKILKDSRQFLEGSDVLCIDGVFACQCLVNYFDVHWGKQCHVI